MGDSAKGEAYSWQNSPGGIYNHFSFFILVERFLLV